MSITFADITPTVFLKRMHSQRRQLVRVTLHNQGAATAGALFVEGAGRRLEQPLASIAPGESVHELFLEELDRPGALTFTLRAQSGENDRRELPWRPPRHWTVHVVQFSHHDVGYTDLASHVIPQHIKFLDDAVDMASATRQFPEAAQFRITVEQVWSIDQYLRHATPSRAAAMVKLIQTGHVEITALFGNMTTELCGHETLARSLYDAARLKREYGAGVISASHDDIPGLTWGLAQALCSAGIKMLCAGWPLYYWWGGDKVPSFWDERAVLGRDGIPGAFWWEAPDGQRLLFWCDRNGPASDCHPSLPGLIERLAQLEQAGYPHNVLRWPVRGGNRDNSPYIAGYAQHIRDWHEQWEYPQLISSTNARFYEHFIATAASNLPVWRGDVPGQDYPAGATSTAAATAVNRRNHADLSAAEALATAASLVTDWAYPVERINAAYTESLWHDEHLWGHHFPCGPTSQTAELEKAEHAYRAAALAHDVVNKAMARFADAVHLDQPGIHLVVFNPLPRSRTDWVAAPLREIDNCGSEMVPASAKDGSGSILSPAILTNRWHVNPPPEILAGHFDLIDVETGDSVPYQIVELDSPYAAIPYAAQRLGLAAGGKRYGFFEIPLGLKRDLCFCARNVPALGYRTYRLAPRTDCPVFSAAVQATDGVLENEFYRLQVNPQTGFWESLFDKELKRELVDSQAVHPFGALVVRDPAGAESLPVCHGVACVSNGPLAASLRVLHTVKGHPHIEQTITLVAGKKWIEWSVHILKDPTPLLEAALAFSFALPGACWRYEGPLNVHEAGHDLLPGAFSNRLTVQNWAAAVGTDCCVLWSSLDAPIISVGHFWPSRISPAHACVRCPGLERPPQTAEDLRGGAIYSCVFNNNFGTNFAVSQCGAALFRYVITSTGGTSTNGEGVNFGQAATTPLRAIFTKHPGSRSLLAAAEFLRLEPTAIQILAFKRAEDRQGIILRLWNPEARKMPARVVLSRFRIREVRLVNLVEEDSGQRLKHTADGFGVELPAKAVVTLRMTGEVALS